VVPAEMLRGTTEAMRKARPRIPNAMKIAFAAAALAFTAAGITHAQTADQAWLGYRELAVKPEVPGAIAFLYRRARNGPGALPQNASDEVLEGAASAQLQSGLMGMLRQGPKLVNSGPRIVLVGTRAEFNALYPMIEIPELGPESFWIGTSQTGGGAWDILVAGGDGRGVLYGAFELLRRVSQQQAVRRIDLIETPAMPIRWVDEWDNADGSIERGYAGRSIFFDAGHVRDDLHPVAEYARLLASVGINGCNLNNVNNAAPFLEPDMLKGVARIADTMRPWGVRVALSVDIASPEKIGGLKTYDPLDPAVIAWWKAKVDAIYSLIPDFAGFTVKADSEGQPGPASYGRTPADAANLLANALAPHGGVVLYRAFVYNHHLDWRDPKADRARAAYDIFHPLDGKFAPNVIVQTKEGPIDFQAQEPVSPLFGGLEHTNQAMEVQITQEYTGQQRHLVYLAPMWKGVLDFDSRTENRSTPVKEILAGKSFHRSLGGPGSPRTGLRSWGGGMIGVAGVGQDAWLGSPLALANLYAFGRLAWDPNLTAEQIAEEWTRQTLGNDPQVVRTVDTMLMQSWPAYVHYTGPLGMQTLTDITGSHYGPNIEASENNGWGQWHRADHEGVGMDRTVATGTGFVGQYPPEVAKTYENVATTPDNLLTFFHHVPYTYKLDQPGFGGKTVIQYIYDSHYEGAEEAARLGDEWATLKEKIDPQIFDTMQARLTYQAGHAIVWRDAIVQYFLKLGGIPDATGRAGHYPGRYEAEDAKLTGYTIVEVHPWEDASRGKAVTCMQSAAMEKTSAVSGHDFSRAENKTEKNGASAPAGTCAAEWTYTGDSGRYPIAAQYFDLQSGTARFALFVNNSELAHWSADAALPTRDLHGDNSTRFTSAPVELKPGDTIRIEGTPDGHDPAALDYIEILPQAAGG